MGFGKGRGFTSVASTDSFVLVKVEYLIACTPPLAQLGAFARTETVITATPTLALGSYP